MATMHVFSDCGVSCFCVLNNMILSGVVALEVLVLN